MNKIIEIILDDNFSLTEKLILIYFEVNGKRDLGEIAEALGIPIEILKDFKDERNEVKKTFETIQKSKPVIHEFIDLFDRLYTKIHGRKFTFMAKEIGQISNIKKKVKEIKEWKRILKTVYYQCEIYKAKGKQKTTWKWICEKLSPSIIYSNLNFILTEVDDFKPQKKWEGFRNDAKNK